ncbi:Type VI secretion system protein ImpH [Burkholderia sp. 8Y]|uniref:type VI secretion system baseplate subunit TssG n=1 Tax=Burkholderia sp. 8Y TaxID=2653133 RepID=UPI0012F12020|nr:type VI secretion system baseplate subunit TssG [Burkholderia sp. 8Y]VXB39421.1 Type VI secretion system protein ImpH [Burkholderia sp. 8Y]
MERAFFKAHLAETNLSLAQIERLQTAPWRYGFVPLMRSVAATSSVEAIGSAQLPATEAFRVGQRPSLVFAPREVASAELRSGKLYIRLFGLGMLGPNGSLPLHVTEIAREREESRRDPTLSNFLDIFHHRSLSLLYRAWASAQSTASLDRSGHERFSMYMASVSGHAIRRDRIPFLPEHARLSAASHLVSEARNLDGLRASLAAYFRVPLRIEEYQLQWMTIPEQNRSIMGEQRMSSYLSAGAMLGERTPDCQYRFRIVLGPLQIEDYQRFTPRGSDLLRLVEWVRAFVSEEYDWELELQIKPESAPPSVLGGPQQLGWSSWLGQSPADVPITGMRFEPEQYMRQLRENAVRRIAARDGEGMQCLPLDACNN